jgi:hypothetical protein
MVALATPLVITATDNSIATSVRLRDFPETITERKWIASLKVDVDEWNFISLDEFIGSYQIIKTKENGRKPWTDQRGVRRHCGNESALDDSGEEEKEGTGRIHHAHPDPTINSYN